MNSHHDPRMAAFIKLFEELKITDVARMGEFYTEQAHFRDPFNEVHDLPGVQRVFTHMFSTLEQPHFLVLDALVQENQGFLTWDFYFLMRGQALERRIHGSSHLRFAADGRVAYHRDYWDAAEELYEQLPLLGGLLRWIKSKLRA